jgi:hypothetical protein
MNPAQQRDRISGVNRGDGAGDKPHAKIDAAACKRIYEVSPDHHIHIADIRKTLGMQQFFGRVLRG